MAKNVQKKNAGTLSQVTMIRFGLGQLTNGNIMNVCNTFYSFFLTNVIMMSATDMGTVQFLSRIASAIAVPVLSSVIQDTNIGKKKLGKYRTLLLLACPLTALAFTVTFVDWHLGRIGSIAYYFATYFVGITLFTIPQTCIQTLMGRMGTYEDTRALASRRSMMSIICTWISSTFTVPLVLFFGNGEKSVKGYFITVLLYSIWYCVGYLLGTVPVSKNADYYESDKESVKKTVSAVTLTAKQKLNAFLCKPYLLSSLGTFFTQIGAFFLSGTQTYFFSYIIGDLAKMTAFLSVGSTVNIVATFLNGAYSKIFGVKRGLTIAMFGQAICFVLAFFFGQNYTVFFILISVICKIFGGLSVSCASVLQSVCADYYYVESGCDARGFMAAMNNFPVKLSSAITAGAVGWGLGALGFDASLGAQSATVLAGIRVFTVLIPAIGYGGAGLMYLLSPLTTAKIEEVTTKSAAMKAAASAEAE